MRPTDEKQLAEAIAGASSPLAIRGGGTRGVLPGGADVLTTSAMSGVSLFEPGALTIIAAAGTPVSEIQVMLDEQGQRLAFEPMDHRGLLRTGGDPTIGGVIAGNVSGPRRIQVGAARDFLLGIRFVDGQGQIIKNGGRVMKNVTGYDLGKLLAGSFGTLGVLSEVALKVLPKPETSATICLPGLSDANAVQAMSAALGSPYDVSGAAHFSGTDLGTVIRVEGFENSVSYRAGKLSEMLAGFADTHIETGSKSVDIWDRICQVEPFHGKAGDVWKLSVKPTDGPQIAERLNADGLLFDWGGGLIWTLVPEGTDLRQRIGDFQGYATLVRASDETRDHIPMFQPETGPLAAISAGIREKYDPRDILNPGLMG